MKVEIAISVLSLLIAHVSCEEFNLCPSISQGYPPYCACRHGGAYDNVTNTCLDPECPAASIAEPAYPNCTCTEPNFAYTAYVNECFRVCPENSTGYWPDCTCDNEFAIFDKKKFKCFTCPADSESGAFYPDCDCKSVGIYDEQNNECRKCVAGSTGLYPNCTCTDELANFNSASNMCEKCTPGSSGKIPACACDNGAEYNIYGNYCEHCPYGTSGIFPKCSCDAEGAAFNGYFCVTCPWGAQGAYGNCTCMGNGVYMKETNTCNDCPANSTGTYPSCVCNGPFQYDEQSNLCVGCPENTNGTYPYCECTNGLFSVKSGLCIECPLNTTGSYPDCECQQEDHVFSAFINECYVECGGNAFGLHPYCKCDEPGTYYLPKEFACKNNIGRPCPPASIGIGPDCLCVQKDYIFIEYFWTCTFVNASFAYPAAASCPGGVEKWPQCSVEIDRNVLLSLVG